MVRNDKSPSEGGISDDNPYPARFLLFDD